MSLSSLHMPTRPWLQSDGISNYSEYLVYMRTVCTVLGMCTSTYVCTYVDVLCLVCLSGVVCVSCSVCSMCIVYWM